MDHIKVFHSPNTDILTGWTSAHLASHYSQVTAEGFYVPELVGVTSLTHTGRGWWTTEGSHMGGHA